jgi:hypothetical protein
MGKNVIRIQTEEKEMPAILAAVEEVRKLGFEITAEKQMVIVGEETTATIKMLMEITVDEPQAFYPLGLHTAYFINKFK